MEGPESASRRHAVTWGISHENVHSSGAGEDTCAMNHSQNVRPRGGRHAPGALGVQKLLATTSPSYMWRMLRAYSRPVGWSAERHTCVC
jgi:hypothetical protein